MADEYEVPELPTYIEIPDINEGIMEGEGPFKSSEEFQAPLGFPGEKVENWKEKAIDKMADLKSKYRSVQVFLDMCVKCGACTDKCHYFLGTSDPKNMPVARQDLFRSVYRRYFTFSGKYFPKLVGAKSSMMKCLMIGITTFINVHNVDVALFSVRMELILPKSQWLQEKCWMSLE